MPAAVISIAPPSVTDTSASQAEEKRTILSYLTGTNSSAAGRKVKKPWHGIRVRIGVHYGLGEIRKDPVTHGYDYYGTVVNTAAHVEGVGHGGQILVTDDAFQALSPNFARDHVAAVIALGPQPLRGLDAPIKLHQFVPQSLQARRFPALRLHIEKVSEDTANDGTETSTTMTGGSAENETPEATAIRICGGRANGTLTVEALLGHYYYVTTLLSTSTEATKKGIIGKLGESWGFESAAASSRVLGLRQRLLIRILAKVAKSYNSNKNRHDRLAGRDSRSAGPSNTDASNSRKRSNTGGDANAVVSIASTSSDKSSR